MARRRKPIPHDIGESISYDPITGSLTYKKKGRVAPVGAQGYVFVTHKSIQYRGARVAYYLYHGIDPADMEIDHINNDRADNRIENLRLVTHYENCQNYAKTKENGGFWTENTEHRRKMWREKAKRYNKNKTEEQRLKMRANEKRYRERKKDKDRRRSA